MKNKCKYISVYMWVYLYSTFPRCPPQGLEPVTPQWTQLVPQVLVSKSILNPFSTDRNQGSMKKWLNPGLGRKAQTGMEHCVEPESKEILKEWWENGIRHRTKLMGLSLAKVRTFCASKLIIVTDYDALNKMGNCEFIYISKWINWKFDEEWGVCVVSRYIPATCLLSSKAKVVILQQRSLADTILIK